jgi:ribosome biogenesis GTPase
MEGIITKSSGSNYYVRINSGDTFECKIKGKLHLQNYKSTSPVAIGDKVQFYLASDNRYGLITEINERKNYIIRKSVKLSKQSHIIAANIDQAFLIVTLINPETTLEFIDRYLVSLEAYMIPVILIFNKIDLYENEILINCNKLINLYETIGYKCLKTSVVNNINIEKFKNLLINQVSVISGNSGVGKSSLINSVEPNLKLKIGEISEYSNSGMHVTSNSEMFYLSLGGYIIDTPGIKGFGLFNFKKNEIYHCFPEIFYHSKGCKYYNCVHIDEPDCAVKTALKLGDIASSRYQNYLNIYMDSNSKYR